jgi:hypothetical protein
MLCLAEIKNYVYQFAHMMCPLSSYHPDFVGSRELWVLLVLYMYVGT